MKPVFIVSLLVVAFGAGLSFALLAINAEADLVTPAASPEEPVAMQSDLTAAPDSSDVQTLAAPDPTIATDLHPAYVSSLERKVDGLIEHIATLEAALARMEEKLDHAPAAGAPVADFAITQESLNDAIREYEEYKRAQEELAAKEQQRMQSGPYGNMNYAVNYAAKQGDFSDYQKECYYEALKSYQELLQDLSTWYSKQYQALGNVPNDSPDRADLIKEYQRRASDLQKGFYNGLRNFLTDDQLSLINVQNPLYPQSHYRKGG